MEYSNNKFIGNLPDEPPYMFSLAKMTYGKLQYETRAQGSSICDESSYPNHHVQAGTFLGNIDLDNQDMYNEMRSSI